jgi:hypothetical protein
MSALNVKSFKEYYEFFKQQNFQANFPKTLDERKKEALEEIFLKKYEEVSERKINKESLKILASMKAYKILYGVEYDDIFENFLNELDSR